MSAAWNATVYLASRAKPVARLADDGTFVLTLPTVLPIRSGVKDAWTLIWRGQQAQAWWRDNAEAMVPGAQLLASGELLRPFDASGRHSGAEIHAAVDKLTLGALPGERAAIQATSAAVCALPADLSTH